MIDSAFVKSAAARCGFSLCGITPAAPIEGHREHLERWIASGRASRTGEYMSRHIDKRTDARLLVEGARSVIVCAVHYKNQAWSARPDNETAGIASYALTTDYHITVKEMLRDMLRQLNGRYPDLHGRCFTDTAPLLEKELAIRAGLGWRGRNSLLVTPQFGSYVLLGEIVVDRTADSYDTPMDYNGCGRCRLCVEACPNGAICDDRTVDARLCIARATMYPGDDDPPLHGWVFGCDLCQQCCPRNLAAPMHTDPRFDTIADRGTITKTYWESLSDEEFDRTFGQTPMAFFRKTVRRK